MPKKYAHGLVKKIVEWAGTYQLYAELAKKGKLAALLLLIEHIQSGYEQHRELFLEGKAGEQDFEILLRGLKAEYDPTEDERKLKENLLYVEISPDSYLYSKFGEKVCGKYLGMSSEPVITKLLNSYTGLYEEELETITVELAYPTSEDVLRLSILDIKDVDTFI